MKPRINPVSSPLKPEAQASRYRSIPKQPRSTPIHPSPPPAQSVSRPQTRSLGTDKGKAVISARLNSSMLAWEDKRGVERQEPKKQVSYLLHQNKLLERVVVSLQAKVEKPVSSPSPPSVSRPRPPCDPKRPPTLQALQALITWTQRYVSTVSPYLTRPDVSVSLARDSLQAAIELAQASAKDWTKGKPQSAAKACYAGEETLVVRKKLLQYQAQRALEFAQCGGKSPFQTLGDALSRTEESLNATKERITVGKTASVGSTPRALLEDERKTIEIGKKLQGEVPSVSLSTVQSHDSLPPVDLNSLLQQKIAAESAVSSLSLQLSQALEDSKSLNSALEKANSDLKTQQITIDVLQRTEISLWEQREMQLEDCFAHILRLEDHCRSLQADLSTVLHDNSSLSRESKACNCAFSRPFPSDLLVELEQVLGSVKAQWREQLNLEDRLRLEITSLEVENDGLRASLKEGMGVRTEGGEIAPFPYSPIPLEGSFPTSEFRTPREPVKACPAALQEIADFEERMKKRLETVKGVELQERSESSGEEYDSSALGRMDFVEGGECSFGLEAASPIPPALSDRANPLSTLHEIQQLVFSPTLKPSDLQTALRSLLSLPAPCAEGQLSPPLSPHHSPELRMSFEGKPLVRQTDPLRSSLDSTGAPPSIRDAVLRILSEVKDPSLGGSVAALSAFFQLTECELQRVLEHAIRSD